MLCTDIMPTWNEFAWAAFLYGYGDYDSVYQNLMNQTQLLSLLRTNPNQLEIDEIKDQVIKGFLNRWKCHIHNNTQSANTIRTTLKELSPYLQAIDKLKIEDVNFSKNVNVNKTSMTIGQVIEYCYTKVRNIGYNFGPTATSKLLHIIQPKLFVMWDNEILKHYHVLDKHVFDKGIGYQVYLELMKKMSNQIITNFQDATLNPAPKANQNPATYLSEQMGYKPHKPLAKYLDEFNFTNITNKVKLPPHWHP